MLANSFKYSNNLLIILDAKFLLLHEGKSEESIKNFFNEVYDLFVKVIYKLSFKINLGSNESFLRIKSKDIIAGI